MIKVWGKDAFKSLKLARILNPARAAATVSGGESTVASITPLVRAASRSATPPLTKIVTALRGIFHSLSAKLTAKSLEPPKLRMPNFLPIRSAGLLSSLRTTTLKGNLFNAAAMTATSPPRKKAARGAMAEPWIKGTLPEINAATPRALPGIRIRSPIRPFFSSRPRSFVAQIGP